MDDKTEQSRVRYNRLAKEYDESFDGKFTLPYNRALCERAEIRDGDAILDVACGNGRLLRMLSQKAHVAAYGVDISEEMVATARAMDPEARFSVGSADQLDFPEDTFDWITVSCAFHHFTKPEVFLKEAHRVLKPGGKLLIADPSPIWLIRTLENLLIPSMKMGDVKMYSVRELLAFFSAAGFADVRYTKKGMIVVVEGTMKTKLAANQSSQV